MKTNDGHLQSPIEQNPPSMADAKKAQEAQPKAKWLQEMIAQRAAEQSAGTVEKYPGRRWSVLAYQTILTATSLTVYADKTSGDYITVIFDTAATLDEVARLSANGVVQVWGSANRRVMSIPRTADSFTFTTATTSGAGIVCIIAHDYPELFQNV